MTHQLFIQFLLLLSFMLKASSSAICWTFQKPHWCKLRSHQTGPPSATAYAFVVLVPQGFPNIMTPPFLPFYLTFHLDSKDDVVRRQAPTLQEKVNITYIYFVRMYRLYLICIQTYSPTFRMDSRTDVSYCVKMSEAEAKWNFMFWQTNLSLFRWSFSCFWEFGSDSDMAGLMKSVWKHAIIQQCRPDSNQTRYSWKQ